MRYFIRLATVLTFAISLGCGSEKTAEGPESSGETKRVIGVSLLTFENPFFKVIGNNITREAKKYGYDTIVLSADEDPAKQNNQLRDFVTRKVSAIVLSPCESRSVVPAIQEANQAGIPVFTVDIPCREEGVDITCQVATDNYGGGKKAAEAMIEALGEAGGKVVILHYKQAESCRLRVKGFREIIDKHNKDAKGKITILDEMEGGGKKSMGSKAAEDAIQTTQDLKGIFCINDPSALGARAAVEKAKKTDQITIVSFDGQPEGKQAIKEGKIYAEPIQFPTKMGVKIVEVIVDHSKGKEVPPEVLIPTMLYKKEDALKDPKINEWQ